MYTLQLCNKILSLRKNQHKAITLTYCKTEFRENICLKISRPDGRLLKMMNDVGEAIAAFVALPETGPIAQPKKLIPQL